MELDDAFVMLGDFGLYQTIIYICISLIGQVPSVWHMLGISFLGALPDHRCSLPTGVPIEEGIPQISDGNGGLEYASCSMYVNVTVSNDTTGCDTWEYDDNVYGETIVTEWDLVCYRDGLVDISQAVFMTGVMVGSVLFGQLSDRFGRRIVWLMSIWIQIAFAVVTAFSQNFIMFTVLRFFVGMLEQGVDLVSYVMVTEMFSPKRRAHAAILLTMFWAAGIMTLPCLAYLIRDWRWLQLSFALPCLLTLPLWWVLPESTRWLISRGRVDEAEAILQKTARFNQTTIPFPILKEHTKNIATLNRPMHVSCNDDITDVDHDAIELKTMTSAEELNSCVSHREYTIADLFRTKMIRKITILIIFIWWVNSIVYYGLSLNTGSLAGNPYVNFFLSGLVETPAYIICPFIIQRFGRRLPLCIFHIIGGVACTITAFIPTVTDEGTDLTPAILTAAMLGKFGITGSYVIVFLYTTELYPTVARNLGLGVASFSSRIGGIMAPFIVLLDLYVPKLPLITFGVLSIMAGICVLSLPETLGRTQPMTIAEVENRNSREKILVDESE